MLILTAGSLRGQQESMYTNFLFNKLSINPAYAGSHGALSLTGLSRLQWVGVEGAPATYSIIGHTPIISKNIGLGFSLISDHIGPINKNNLQTDYSFTIQTSQTTRLAFGLKASLNHFNGKLTELDIVDKADMAFAQDITSSIKPNFGFGLYFHAERWYVGASAPRLIENEYLKETSAVLGAETRHYFLLAGYVLDINDNVKFKPAGLLRAVEGSPLSFDVSANFLFSDLLWAGLSYRHQESVAMVLKMKISDQLDFGYSYDYGITGISTYATGSHEILISYLFVYNKNNIYSPRYF